MATQLRLNGKSMHVKAEADTPGGIGEPATALTGRAVGNAVFRGHRQAAAHDGDHGREHRCRLEATHGWG